MQDARLGSGFFKMWTPSPLVPDNRGKFDVRDYCVFHRKALYWQTSRLKNSWYAGRLFFICCCNFRSDKDAKRIWECFIRHHQRRCFRSGIKYFWILAFPHCKKKAFRNHRFQPLALERTTSVDIRMRYADSVTRRNWK